MSPSIQRRWVEVWVESYFADIATRSTISGGEASRDLRVRLDGRRYVPSSIWARSVILAKSTSATYEIRTRPVLPLLLLLLPMERFYPLCVPSRLWSAYTNITSAPFDSTAYWVLWSTLRYGDESRCSDHCCRRIMRCQPFRRAASWIIQQMLFEAALNA